MENAKPMSLSDLTKKFKNSKTESVGTKYIIRVPEPDKPFAKTNGAKWNPTEMHWFIKTDDLDTHPLKDYLTTNPLWAPLKHSIPASLSAAFKQHGVVNEEVDGKWQSYVLCTERYTELLNALMEVELL